MSSHFQVYIERKPYQITVNQTQLIISSIHKTTNILSQFLIGTLQLGINLLELCIFNPVRNKLHKKIIEFSNYSEMQDFQQAVEITSLGNYYSEKRHIVFIINPNSGVQKGQQHFDRCMQQFLQYLPFSFECIETISKDFTANWINTADLDSITDIVCISGDGLMHFILSQLWNSPELKHYINIIRFGMIPAGTRNGLSCTLNGKSVMRSCFHIAKGFNIKGDLMRIQIDDAEMVATSGLCWGLGAETVEGAENLRSFGRSRYVLSGIRIFFTSFKSHRANILCEDTKGIMREIEDNFDTLFVVNHRSPDIDSKELLSPDESLSSGTCDQNLILSRGRFRLLSFLIKMGDGGRHRELDWVQSLKVTKTRISPVPAGGQHVYNVDGELYYGDVCEIECMPDFVNFIGVPYEELIQQLHNYKRQLNFGCLGRREWSVERLMVERMSFQLRVTELDLDRSLGREMVYRGFSLEDFQEKRGQLSL